MDVGLALDDEEELTIGGLYGVCTDERVSLEAVDCTLAILLRRVVGAFVYIFSACIVERVEILLRAVFLVNVLDDVFAVDDGLVKACDFLRSFSRILGSFESGKRRSDFLDDDFLVLVGVERFEFRFFCGKFLCKSGRRRAFVIASVFGIVIVAFVSSVVFGPIVGFLFDDFFGCGFVNALFLRNGFRL